jgi:hypothetical protein
MKKYFQNNRSLIYIVVCGLVLYGLFKSLLNSSTNFFTKIFARSSQADYVAGSIPSGTPTTSPGAPLPSDYIRVEGIVESVTTEINSLDQDEKRIVRDMNTLTTKEQVLYASNYYHTSEGGSLRAALQDALAADWRGSGFIGGLLNPNAVGSRFEDLSTVVKMYVQ